MGKYILLIVGVLVIGCTAMHGQQSDSTQQTQTPNNTYTPDPGEFVAVEREPGIDIQEIANRVVYPASARSKGTEGTVIINVLVSRKGQPIKYLIDHSVDKELDQAAVNAVMACTFTPAIQNKQPIDCWVTIPVKFKIRSNPESSPPLLSSPPRSYNIATTTYMAYDTIALLKRVREIADVEDTGLVSAIADISANGEVLRVNILRNSCKEKSSVNSVRAAIEGMRFTPLNNTNDSEKQRVVQIEVLFPLRVR